MRQSRFLLPGVVAAGLVLAAGAALFAGNPDGSRDPAKREARKAPAAKRGVRAKDAKAASPAVPTGVPRVTEPSGGAYETDASRTITEHRNERGEIVYSISASQFDISPPLRDMAAKAVPGPEGEEESPANPLLPRWRIPHSGVADPVVQAIPSAEFPGQRGFPLEAPTTGFNFLGVGQSGSVPPDTNGSVGNDQYVETVNTRYQVWSLNRITSVATSVLGPVSINTLWSGFGGACETQNAGDPIVVYDKLANRWLISQFTSAISGGSYFQCVALSTSANATGTYARWAFAVPGGNFGDYPHFGVWTDAYYMMAHAFTAASGGSYVAGVFAAMDRTKMLAGDPTATWQVILDSNEGGHMPADLDGVAPPPTSAPGIFLSLHGPSMYFYRMKVDFVTPANTARTLQGTAPVAAATGACALAGGSCIPQPGTTRLLDSLGDRLMFRAAYRNLIDHESVVISHSVDPSVTGLVSGVRWYDFRVSGTPDAVCATYPCTYQQGTIADVANGRSRWMPSIAMDGAENILVGYSTTGKTNLSENQSVRYTGRAKGDPLGQMTVAEATIVTGVRNNTNNSRWGDYSSMSVDPADDCTFWYANEYYPVSNNVWATRIASVVYPVGSGAGQCQPTTCPSRPGSAPTIGSASVPGANQIQVTWTGIAPTPGAYAIERAVGACGSEGVYQPLAAVSGASSSYTDATVQGGLTYSYRVIAAADAAGRCQAFVASGCASTTATGTCNLRPAFAGATSGTSNDASLCGVNVNWTPATSGCPLTPNMRYNIFRGTMPDFVPSPANRIAACAPGPSSYLDTDNLASGVTYYYVVRSEDDSTGNGGECGGGNEESNSIVVSGTAYGPGAQASPGTWTDSGGDGTAFLRLNVAGAGDTGDQAWRFVKTANDAGANHTAGGAYAYRNTGPAAANTYFPNVCAEMQSPPLIVDAATTNLQYWERHQVEYHWDGIAVEFSRNNGAWTTVSAPSNSAAVGCAAGDVTTNWENLSCTGAPPANACGYATTYNVFNGPLGGGTSCTNWATAAITSYAHRCHPITGLVPGDTIQFRWRFTSDSGAEFSGFYLDDIAVTNVRLPNSCTPNTCAAQPNGTACSDGNACTQNDSCQADQCAGSNPVICSASDQCHDAGTCDTATGVCSDPVKPNGTSCDDSDACTQSDTCQSGACTGANPVVCTPLDACHDTGTCDSQTGLCSNPAKPDGTACGDAGTECTNQDRCVSGACQDNGFQPSGTACGDATDTACNAADTCDGAGACQANLAASGTACGSSSDTACDDPDTCDGAGTCAANPAADGTACSDGDACTQTDQCLSAACVGGNPVVCGASDQCHVAGICNPQTGFCSNPDAPDGTACDDGNACTVGDGCLTGICQPGAPRDADGDGHIDGVCGGDDCNDADPAVWGSPFDVTNLSVLTNLPANLTWDGQGAAAGPGTLYDLVSGDLLGPGPIFPFATGVCLQNSAATSYGDARPDPVTGVGYWYLVRARNTCGTGTYGTAQEDTDIPACP